MVLRNEFLPDAFDIFSEAFFAEYSWSKYCVKLDMIIKFLVSGYLYQDSWTSWALPGDKSCWRKSSQNEVIFFLEKIPIISVSLLTSKFFCNLAKILLVFVWIFPMEFSTQKGSWAPSIEIELWGRIALTVLMSYSEKSPGYLAQMQNWPSVADLRTRGGRRVDGQQTFSLRYFWALTLRGDQRVHVTFSCSSKSKKNLISCENSKRTLLKNELENIKFDPLKKWNILIDGFVSLLWFNLYKSKHLWNSKNYYDCYNPQKICTTHIAHVDITQ